MLKPLGGWNSTHLFSKISFISYNISKFFFNKSFLHFMKQKKFKKIIIWIKTSMNYFDKCFWHPRYLFILMWSKIKHLLMFLFVFVVIEMHIKLNTNYFVKVKIYFFFVFVSTISVSVFCYSSCCILFTRYITYCIIWQIFYVYNWSFWGKK